MPAIIFSRIISLGCQYDVFSLGAFPEHPEKYADIRGRVASVFILPSVGSDIRIKSSDLVSESLFSYMPAAFCAAKFLLRVRGVPLSEVTVETPLGTLTVLSENGGKCYMLFDRFSSIYQGFTELLGERIPSLVLGSPFGKIRTLRVKSAENFSPDLLRQASLSREGEEIIGAVAFDEYEKVIYHFLGSGEYPKALTAVIAAASSMQKEKFSLKIGEDIFDILSAMGKFAVSDRAPEPLTFYAPPLD